MAVKQSTPVVPPRPTDAKLRDFSQIIDGNLQTLFQFAHIHKIVTSAPAANEGAIGDVYLGDISGGKQIYIKFSDGWYAVSVTKV